METTQTNNRTIMIPLAASAGFIVLLVVINAWTFMDNRAARESLKYLEQETRTISGFFDDFKSRKNAVNPIDMSEVSQLIDEITRLGRQQEVDFIAIQSQKPAKQKKDIYKRMPVEISVRSNFREVADYLGALRELETTAIVITAFKLERDKESPALVRGDIIGEVFVKE